MTDPHPDPGELPSHLSPPSPLRFMPSPSHSESASAPKPSLALLFESEEGGLLRFAFGLVGRRAIAEEIVQEAFLQLHGHWDSVEQPRAWLYRCVKNRALNHRRDRKREVSVEGAEASADPGMASQDPTPESLLQRMEAAGFLRLLLAEMEEGDRRLVHLKYFENLRYREIAERTEMSIGNVGYRLHHILRQLADKLCQLGIDGVS